MNMISVENLSFSYEENTEVLHNVSFKIDEGSYTAIAGSNGSGKSTLCRLLCGLLENKTGHILVKDDALMALVFQSPEDQLVSSIVHRDTAFGPQNLGLNKGEVELRTIESLNITGMLENAEKSTSSISLGQTQKVSLSGMLALYPDVLILDEAVSMLDPPSRKSIFEFLRYWHKKGKTIIHITHDMEAVLEADSVLCLNKGNLVFDGTKEDFFQNKELISYVKGPELPESRRDRVFSEKSLSVKNLDFHYKKNDDKSALHNINFSLYKGTVTAITGPSGAGKSTLLEICAGLLQPDFQEDKTEQTGIFCDSKPAIAFQNCSNSLFESFAADDVAFGPKNLGISGLELKKRVVDSMNAVNLPFEEFGEKHSILLSGGQQRKLAIAGILALNKDVILFDEPTAGLDGKSRYEMMMLFKKLAAEGKTVFFSTHQMEEAAFSDREIKIEKGRIVSDSLDETEVNQNENNLPEMKTYEASSMLTGLRNAGSSLSGENHKGKSPVEKMPSVLRILLFALLFVCSLAFRTWWASLIMVAVSFVYCVLCGFSAKKLLVSILKIMPFLLFFCIFQLIFQKPLADEIHFTEWKWFMITPSKLILCLNGILRTTAAICCISGFFVSTPEFDLIDGIKKILYPLTLIKIPVRYFILIVEIIFRFIPLLIKEAYSIMKTQITRGGLGKQKGKMGKIRAVIPLIVPLIIQTIRKSEALSDAIMMRCFK